MLGPIEWLCEHNGFSQQPVGFRGLDLYRLHRSAEAVLRYLDKVDPDAE